MNAIVRQDWWSRNWKWAVPVGFFALVAAGAGSTFWMISLAADVLKSTDLYKQAKAMVKSDPAVIEVFGTPLHDGFMPSGQFHSKGTYAQARLQIPVSGPKGNGMVLVEGAKSGGTWSLLAVAVEIKGSSRRIDILTSPDATPNPTVKRTHPGGAHLRTHRASGAPVYAAYLGR